MKRYIKQIFADGSNLLGEVLFEGTHFIKTRVFMSCDRKIPPLIMALQKGQGYKIIEISEEELMLEIL